MNGVLETALGYLRAGLGVLPIRADGSKAPDLPRGHPYLKERPDEKTVRAWFADGRRGIGVPGGAVSGGLECLDFETRAAFDEWSHLVEAQLPGLVGRLSLASTPGHVDAGPGVHARYRCPGVSLKTGPLARDAGGELLVETRGEGAYAVAPGSPPACHETGRRWEHAGGPPLAELPTVTALEREVLVASARALNQEVGQADAVACRPGPAGKQTPGDDYSRRGPDWAEILEPHGWVVVRTAGAVRYWRRPGKDRGVSATTGHCRVGDVDLLHVFTSSAQPFAQGKSYSKFRALGLLEHGGDFRAAAAAVRELGYGPGPRAEANGHAPRAQARATAGANGHAPRPAGPAEDHLPEITAADVATIGDLKAAGAKVEWVWEGWIQRGVLTAIAGRGGAGKTRFTADLLRRVARGLPWPDGSGQTLPPDSLALWVVADNHHDEMVSLSEAFGVEHLVRINAHPSEPYGGVSLDAPEDLRDLEARVRAVRPALVVVDTVGNATDRNLSKQEDAKAFYAPLQVIARKYRCAVLCLTHLNSGGQFLGRRVLEKVRTAIRLEQYEGEPRRRLEVVKTNSRQPGALGVTMGDAGNEYDGNPPEAPEAGPGGGGAGQASPRVRECADWLRMWLSVAPMKVKLTRDEAEKKGFAAGILYPAMRLLKVQEFQAEGCKWWELASEELPQ